MMMMGLPSYLVSAVASIIFSRLWGIVGQETTSPHQPKQAASSPALANADLQLHFCSTGQFRLCDYIWGQHGFMCVPRSNILLEAHTEEHLKSHAHETQIQQ